MNKSSIANKISPEGYEFIKKFEGCMNMNCSITEIMNECR